MEIIDICYESIEHKRKQTGIIDLYINLMGDGYLTFEETDLLEAILNDGRFIVDGEDKLISEKYISVSFTNSNC